jgi:Bacterial PH domain
MFSAAPPSARPEVFRRTGPVVFWWIWLAFALLNVVDLAIQGSGHFAIVVTAILVAVTGGVYACALRPRVIASGAGLAVKNPVRDHRIPWGAVEAVDVGDWVRVHCAPAPGAAGGKTIDCWALFAPARTKFRAERQAKDPAAMFKARRLPDEARHLVSLSVPQAIAVQLDERARREHGRGAVEGTPTATWAWPSLAAMVVPALAVIIVVFA